jgi:hypothetical protein
MRLAALVVLAAALGLVATPAAAGTVKRGGFAGSTSADDRLSFRVDGRGRVMSFAFTAVALTCSDGDSVDTPRVVTPRKERFRVRSNRFGISARNGTTGFGWDAEGVFRRRGRRATGTLRVFASFNDQNEQDARGSIKCESEPLTWSARRRR